MSLIRARIQALRGEYEVAEETLLEKLTDRSLVEQAEVYREVLQQRLARGDGEQARALSTELVKNIPNSSPLLQLTAEVELRWSANALSGRVSYRSASVAWRKVARR